MKQTKNFLIVFLSVVLLFGTGCSTRKNTFTNRVYHTVTSKYNVNFNGKEALVKGESDLQKGTYVFEYDLRVSQKGEFSNGITTIQSMYAPEFTSHSEGVRVVVGIP